MRVYTWIISGGEMELLNCLEQTKKIILQLGR